MVKEEVIIQTADEISAIDYMKGTNKLIDQKNQEAQDNIANISKQLDVIQDTITNINTGVPDSNVDLSEVTTLIEDIDTSTVQAQTQDILTILNNQQSQINDINEKIDLILNKL